MHPGGSSTNPLVEPNQHHSFPHPGVYHHNASFENYDNSNTYQHALSNPNLHFQNAHPSSIYQAFAGGGGGGMVHGGGMEGEGCWDEQVVGGGGYNHSVPPPLPYHSVQTNMLEDGPFGVGGMSAHTHSHQVYASSQAYDTSAGTHISALSSAGTHVSCLSSRHRATWGGGRGVTPAATLAAAATSPESRIPTAPNISTNGSSAVVSQSYAMMSSGACTWQQRRADVAAGVPEASSARDSSDMPAASGARRNVAAASGACGSSNEAGAASGAPDSGDVPDLGEVAAAACKGKGRSRSRSKKNSARDATRGITCGLDLMCAIIEREQEEEAAAAAETTSGWQVRSTMAPLLAVSTY